MKKLLITGLLLMSVAALAVWGNTMLGRVLDAELPPLLTRELGIPVSIAPIRARGLALTVYTPRLVMGPADDPALVATGVAVSLYWSDLLRGEVRLRRASGATLMVDPSKWPGSDGPWPDNYRFLDPWLPDVVLLDEGHYIHEGGDLTLRELAWQREGDRASLTGLVRPDGVEIHFDTRLDSLPDLLALSRLPLTVTTSVPGQDNSTVRASLILSPGADSGYQLTVDAGVAGSKIHVEAGNDASWQLPAHSDTTVDTLDIRALKALVGDYSRTASSSQEASAMSSKLPRLALPSHRGSVTIEELHLGDESTRNTTFRFSTGDDGISVTSLHSTGPAAELQGDVRVAGGDAGWRVALTAALTALKQDQSMAPQFMEVDWLWRSGHASLNGAGTTWGGLLDSLQGRISLAGSHRGRIVTPVTIDAHLDNRPGELALEDIDVRLGKGRVKGSVRLSSGERRLLTADLTGDDLDLGFLADEEATGTRGLPLPTFLLAFPTMDLDWHLTVNGVRFRELKLAFERLDVARNATGGRAEATLTGGEDSSLTLQLEADTHPDQPTDVRLKAVLSRVNLPRLFGQTRTTYDYRTSGTANFHGTGSDLEAIFRSLQGDSEFTVDFRKDHDWSRPTDANERVQIQGRSQLVMADHRILGVQIEGLHIESIQQDITGSLRLVDGGSPWFQAELQARQLDVTHLLSLRDTTSAALPDEGSSLRTLRDLGSARLTVSVDELILLDQPLSNVTLRVESAPGSITLQQLDLQSGDSRLESHGQLRWQASGATLSAQGAAHDFDLDRFVLGDTGAHHVPVSGTFSLASSGATFTELLADLTGELDLQESRPQPDPVRADRRRLALTARRIADGMEAEIRSFQWGDSDLAGSFRFHDTTPPLLELNLTGGNLALQPVKQADQPDTPTADKPEVGSPLTEAAKASADFVGSMLLEPFRLLAKPEETASNKRFFSREALPLDLLRGYNARIKGRLDTLHSPVANAKDVTLDASVDSGDLTVKSTFGTWNSGSADMTLNLDTTTSPPTATATASFTDVYGLAGPDKTFSRSGFASLSSSGGNPAQLAGNLNGTAFMTLGKGPLDYRRLTLLTADLATTVFDTLIPGSRTRQPELECGATLFSFKDGIGATPYGYGLRTKEANLVGRIELDLKREILKLEFSSSSRSGVGLSVGNVFSNTVKVQGPLTDPVIVPNTTGILWRGAAAFVTSGLSILGESMLKRALASENPCTEIEKHIRKDICASDNPAASSPLVCPGNT